MIKAKKNCLNSGTQNRIGLKATARINSIAIQILVIIKIIKKGIPL